MAKTRQSVWSQWLFQPKIAFPTPVLPGSFAARARQQNSFTPLQVLQAYWPDVKAAGAGQTLGIIELNGGYDPNSLNQFMAGLADRAKFISVKDGSGNAGSNSPDGAEGAEGEWELDIEVIGQCAPHANLAVYGAPNTETGLIAAIEQSLTDHVFSSLSWGGPVDTFSVGGRKTLDRIIENAYGKGHYLCVASGDQGSRDGELNPISDYPMISPYVIGVGGTSLRVNAGKISSEVVWSGTVGASGGGFYVGYALNPWEQHLSYTVVGGKPHPLMYHGGPAVAANADPNTGYQVVVAGQETIVGGTSAAAPLWAAILALVSEATGKPIVDPLRKFYGSPSSFRDVTSGNNGDYEATRGWDPCTGWGTPNGDALVKLLG